MLGFYPYFKFENEVQTFVARGFTRIDAAALVSKKEEQDWKDYQRKLDDELWYGEQFE